jgi:putative membrane protein
MNNLAKLNERTMFRIVLVISIVVFALVLILNRKILPRPESLPEFATFLPALNAFINATCSILLIASYRAIRAKKVDQHRALNLTTFLLSALFIISYVAYHWMADETTYPAESPVRPFYLAILFSHIILAALVLPLVLISFYYGLTNQVIKHRKITRWSFPIWLYVTVTGVIVYFMIAPYYPF